MIVTLTLVIGASIGVGSAVVGGVVGFLVGNRRRNERQADEQYERLINYYSHPQGEHHEPAPRSVFSRL